MREIRTSGLTRGEEDVLRHRLLSYSTATHVCPSLVARHLSLVTALSEENRWRNMETPAEPRYVFAVQSTFAGKDQ
jgi:hypothetical protein